MNEYAMSSLEYQPLSMPISGGALLRAAREAEGISIESIAASLKVPVAKLEALEADQLDLLPDIVFIRALVSSLCRTLKIESAPILEKFPHKTLQQLKTDESGINAPFSGSNSRVDLKIRLFILKPVVLAVILLLLGVLLITFAPLKNLSGPLVLSKSSTALVESKLPITNTSELAIVKNTLIPVASKEVTALNLISSGSKILTVENQENFAKTSPMPSNYISESIPKIIADSKVATSLVNLKARGSSWIEIIDAKKVIQFRRTLVSGEIISMSGTPPLSVTVGRADVIDVEVRGKPINLTTISKDNVARFEVK